MRYAEVLDAEWRRIADSPEACRRLQSWATRYPALAGYADLQDVLDARAINETASRPILLALARLAPEDEIAARTLLQAMLPRIVRLVSTKCTDDQTADEELVALAWGRIRTYPPTRIGSVAANVMRDAYKQYRADHKIKAPKTRTMWVESFEAMEPHPSAEDEAMSYVLIGELVRARDRGLVSTAAVGLILRTRVAETPLHVISVSTARPSGDGRPARATPTAASTQPSPTPCDAPSTASTNCWWRTTTGRPPPPVASAKQAAKTCQARAASGWATPHPFSTRSMSSTN